MPNSCGYAVLTVGTTAVQGARLYPAAHAAPQHPEYKSSTFPRLQTQVIQQLIHHFHSHFTTVTERFFPTIHTTNKNNKKYFLNNLLLINRKAV